MTGNQKEKHNKIHIIGEVGSGKTYLAKKLSQLLNIPYYQLDNVVWSRGTNNDTRNPPEVRDAILNNILDGDSWIIEGVHYKWVLRSFELSDVIFYLDVNVFRRDKQIITRFIKQRMGLEVGNYTQSIGNLYKMLVWSHNFDKEGKPKIAETLMPYQDKVRYFTKNEEAINYMIL